MNLLYELKPRPLRDPKLILVAEDDLSLRLSLMSMIRRLGLAVVGASTGDELLGWVEPLLLLEDHGRSPDAIITDIRMPGIEALEIVEGLAHVGRHVPVIVVSGVADTTTRDRVADLGYPWVDKPIVPRQLERAIRQALAASYRRATMT